MEYRTVKNKQIHTPSMMKIQSLWTLNVFNGPIENAFKSSDEMNGKYKLQ